MPTPALLHPNDPSKDDFYTSKQFIRCMPSLFEHQIHQNIIYTSNRGHSMQFLFE